MNIIAKSRGMGKTWDIVKRSIETGYPILCFYSANEMYMRELAKKQGYDPKKLNIVVCDRTNGEFDLSSFYNINDGSDTIPCIIDEAEWFFQTLLRKYIGRSVKIDTMSINNENVILPSNPDIIRADISDLLTIYSKFIKNKDSDYGKALNILKNIEMLQTQLNEYNKSEYNNGGFSVVANSDCQPA